MNDDSDDFSLRQPSGIDHRLTDILRSGGRRLLVQTIELGGAHPSSRTVPIV
jgi:hypothetical protein